MCGFGIGENGGEDVIGIREKNAMRGRYLGRREGGGGSLVCFSCGFRFGEREDREM